MSPPSPQHLSAHTVTRVVDASVSPRLGELPGGRLDGFPAPIPDPWGLGTALGAGTELRPHLSGAAHGPETSKRSSPLLFPHTRFPACPPRLPRRSPGALHTQPRGSRSFPLGLMGFQAGATARKEERSDGSAPRPGAPDSVVTVCRGAGEHARPSIRVYCVRDDVIASL